MFKILVIIVLLVQYINADCSLDDNIIVSILMKERSKQKKAGYEYLISFNNEKDQKKIKNTKYKTLMLNSRTMDCINQEQCVHILNDLFSKGYINLDVGAFQINSYYHKLKTNEYFDFNTSYNFACNYINEKIKKFGYNWYSIAAYHSENEEYNEPYQEDIIVFYEKSLSLE